MCTVSIHRPKSSMRSGSPCNSRMVTMTPAAGRIGTTSGDTRTRGLA
jgi:hypothetical protein